MAEIIPVFFALIGVLALMAAAMYGLKALRGHIGTAKGTHSGIKLVSAVGAGQDKSIVAVKAGKKNLLVGITPSSMSLLCELDEEDMALIEGAPETDMSGKSFAECFMYSLKKKTGFDKGEESVREDKNNAE